MSKRANPERPPIVTGAGSGDGGGREFPCRAVSWRSALGRIRLYELGLSILVCLLLAWSAWARAGTVRVFQPPMAWVALAALIMLAGSCFRSGKTSTTAGTRHEGTNRWGSWTILLAGFGFMALLTLQAWNTGRHAYFHPFDKEWAFTPPPYLWLPWSVNRTEAVEMLYWFFPAWVLALVFRWGVRQSAFFRTIVFFMIGHAALLALLGIAQQVSGTARMFWWIPMKTRFFASFGYENHAASFFALHAGLAFGVLIQSTRQMIGENAETPGNGGMRPVIASAACASCCVAGLFLCLSRTGIAFGVAITLGALAYAGRVFWKRMSVSQRISALMAVILTAALVFFLVATIGGDSLKGETARLVGANVPTTLNSRLFLANAAIRIWRDSPWFGSGGWGFRHFLPAQTWGSGMTIRTGFANVHNDILQFLCEFGMAGMVLMGAIITALLAPLATVARRHPGSGILAPLAGLAAVVAHSLIDLPFRSPGILYAWIAIAGVTGFYFDGRKDPQHDGARAIIPDAPPRHRRPSIRKRPR